ncbi:unnamed protein product [Ixodes persulcatus]
MSDPTNGPPIEKLIPSSIPELYARSNAFQRNTNITCLDFLQQTFSPTSDVNQQFLDVGCGTGDFTRQELLPRCQPCRRIVATEVVHETAEYAKKHSAHPQIVYEEHDIRGDVSELEAKYGKFDRVYSLFALHWVEDQAATLRNIVSLMKDDGDCVLVFAARTTLCKIWKRIVQLDRWTAYDELSKRFIAKSQNMEDRSTLVSYMLDTLKSANLKPLTCEVITAVQSVEDSDLVMGIRSAVSPMLPFLSEDRRLQFMNDLEEVLRTFWTEKDPTDQQYHMDTFVVHAKKNDYKKND